MNIRWHHYKYCKCQTWHCHVEELVEMIELDIWFTQLGVRTQKFCKLQVSDSCCAEAIGRLASPRLAGPTPLQSTSFLSTRPLGTLQWSPMHWILKQIQKIWSKGRAHGLKDPSVVLAEIFWIGAPIWTSCTLWSICRWNGGPRYANSRPAGVPYNFQLWTNAAYTNTRWRSGASTRRSAP